MKIASRTVPPIPEKIWDDAARLRREHPDVLSHPVAMTRLLCGVASPRISRAKLRSHALFGKLNHVPFQQVRNRLSPD